MRYVGYDQFRRQPAQARGSRRRRSGVLMPVLVCASVALLVVSRFDVGVIANARIMVAEAAAPVLRRLMVPLEPVRAGGAALWEVLGGTRDLERLTSENQRLKEWEARARDLERQLGELGAVANAARERDVAFVTARLIATSSGPFRRSALINAGADEGLKAGFPALAGNGLAGQVAAVRPTGARLMLITHADSRVPVFVGQNGARAVLVGDDGPAPRLIFSEPGDVAHAGDEVSTSGLDGKFPRGLRIGIVRESGERASVAPYADLDRLEYVSILFYDSGVGDEAPPGPQSRIEGERQVPP